MPPALHRRFCFPSVHNNMKDDFWVEVSNSQSNVCKKRKRRVGKRKLEFVGWGSRPLIEFLEAIGQDSREKRSQQEVASLVSKYINDKGLASAEKKKKVLCDERLFILFGKKSMLRTKVYDMLEEHFAENHDDSDNELLDSSDEDYGEKESLELRNISFGQLKKKVVKTPKSCFAAIIPENIKLIYLKRSVIQDLLKFPESFDFKVVGSFVRVKSDPNDIYQKNRFQLLQVTGVQKLSVSGDADIEIYLRLSNYFKDVSMGMLSDDNFTEEEVKEVWERIKAGSLNRLTVNELQLKAQVLHADITNNWIAKEIHLLQKLAEHANEKGWQREKFEYLERRKMLQNPSEREKLLLKVPDVVAEELEPELISEKADISACSPKSILRGSSDVSSTDAAGSGEIGTPPKVISSDSHTLEVQDGGADCVIHIPPEDPKVFAMANTRTVMVCDPSTDTVKHETVVANMSCGVGYGEGTVKHETVVANMSCGEGNGEGIVRHKTVVANVSCVEGNGEGTMKHETVVAYVSCGEGNREVSGEKHPQQQQQQQQPSATAVIELSDDDDDVEVVETVGRNCGENPNEAVWHYLDPQGQTQGPFKLCLLKQWSDANYFHPSFTVWKTGQTSRDGLLLLDVLRRTFQY